jgi:hypothetical protein
MERLFLKVVDEKKAVRIINITYILRLTQNKSG